MTRLIVRDSKIPDVETTSERAMITNYWSTIKKHHVCRKRGPLAKNCWHKNSENNNSNNNGSGKNYQWTCFRCGKQGLSPKFGMLKDPNSDNSDSFTAILTLLSVLTTSKDEKSSQWLMDSARTRLMTNDRSNFCSFTQSLSSIHVGSKTTNQSFHSKICKDGDDGEWCEA